METEWTATDRSQLQVPLELRERQRHRFTIPAPIGLSGTCAEWVHVPGGITLRDALLDTSQRVAGTVLEYRVTHRIELTIIGAQLIIFPMNLSEIEHGR